MNIIKKLLGGRLSPRIPIMNTDELFASAYKTDELVSFAYKEGQRDKQVIVDMLLDAIHTALLNKDLSVLQNISEILNND
jgi:hypothetical protein